MALLKYLDININKLMKGNHYFTEDTPLWDSQFGDDEWYENSSGAYLLWNDLIFGRGTVKSHPNSVKKSRYEYCLTPSMVSDLKIAAAIHGLYPSMLANSPNGKGSTSLDTVKGRIDDVAKFYQL
jgi:hypothetical protein